MQLSNFRVGSRLTAGFSLLLLLIVFLVVFSLMVGARSRAETYVVLDNLNHQVELTQQIRYDASEQEALFYHSINQRNDTTNAKSQEMLQTLNLAMNEKYEALRQSDQDQATLQKLILLGKTVNQLRENALKLNVDNLQQDTFSAMHKELISARKEQANALTKYVDSLLSQQKSLPGELEQAYRKKAFSVIPLVLIIIIGFGIYAARILTRSVTIPIQEAAAVAHQIAAGNLNVSVEPSGRDELSDLMHAIRDMNRALSGTVGKVRNATDVISVAAREIAQGNSDLSARTESQASSLEQTVSAMGEFTETVRQNADNAKQANQLIIQTSEVATRGGAVVNQVVTTMTSIKENSNKIVDIIGVIDGIAFQTNILALNAAVEAARAGEQGRGFAVVATEVRNLAQRSAAAAKEIKQLIGTSVETVNAGEKLVTQAGQTMHEIVSSVQKTTQIMREITAASQEQRTGIEEVNLAITQIDEMTQQNAALVEQAAAAAQSMDDQARELLGAVSAFKLNDRDSYAWSLE